MSQAVTSSQNQQAQELDIMHEWKTPERSRK